MINFIICDDNEKFALKIRQIAENYMMNYDIETKYYMFTDYGRNFYKIVDNLEGFNVYILDIETKNGSGLDATRHIREELDDWNSIIILITVHNELKYEALGNRLFLFDFINKFDNYENKLKEDLKRTIKNYDNRKKCLTFEINRVIKKIDFKHILMINKEKDSKKCNIITTYGNYEIHNTVNNILRNLDERFIKINRSTIVNIEHIIEYDCSENKLSLKNGIVTFEVSRDYKKKVMEIVKYNR